MWANEYVELLRDRFKNLKGSCIRAVLVFGSRARGEAEGKSDLDLLILHEGCGVEDPVLRRRYLYSLIREVIDGVFEDITVIDMMLKHFLKPVEINSLLLNIYWDAIVVYDETDILQEFLIHVRESITKCGLKRVKNGKAYYWILPEPMKKVEILEY